MRHQPLKWMETNGICYAGSMLRTFKVIPIETTREIITGKTSVEVDGETVVVDTFARIKSQHWELIYQLDLGGIWYKETIVPSVAEARELAQSLALGDFESQVKHYEQNITDNKRLEQRFAAWGVE